MNRRINKYKKFATIIFLIANLSFMVTSVTHTHNYVFSSFHRSVELNNQKNQASDYESPDGCEVCNLISSISNESYIPAIKTNFVAESIINNEEHDSYSSELIPGILLRGPPLRNF